MLNSPKRALICGIGGQDGAYLARLLLAKEYQVSGTSRDAMSSIVKQYHCPWHSSTSWHGFNDHW